MKKSVTVRGVTIGEGVPKICVSLVGETLSQLTEEAKLLKTLDLDVVEWRVDFFEGVENINKVKTAIDEIRAILTDKPLIFTFRSAKEGGKKQVSTEFYVELNKAIIEAGLADIIDIELSIDRSNIETLIEIAHSNDLFVILSTHDFEKTPAKEEIVSRLCKAQELGADLPKIAVMPSCAGDVITLLDATNTMKEVYNDTPVITISMAGTGVISRLSGEIFGSALTFGAAKKASAPGQVAVKELRSVLNLLHSSL